MVMLEDDIPEEKDVPEEETGKTDDMVSALAEGLKTDEQEDMSRIMHEKYKKDLVENVKKMSHSQVLKDEGDVPTETPFHIAAALIKERQLKGGRMGMNDDLCNTNLISKNYSPMFIRKFNPTPLHNWPLYVAMICDEDVSDIDHVVNGALRAYKEAGLVGNNLQQMRNLTGIISETLSTHYDNKKENCVEGIAVTLYVDKAYIQSFTGDFMNHGQCRAEYTAALHMMTQI